MYRFRKAAGRATARLTLAVTVLLMTVAPFVLHQVQVARADLPAPAVSIAGGTLTASIIPSGTQTVQTQATVTVSPVTGVPVPDASVSGTITGSGTLTLAMAGYHSASVTMSVGTWSAGTITLQDSIDGGNTYSTTSLIPPLAGSGGSQFTNLSTGSLSFNSVSSGGIVLLPGTTHVRLSASAITGTTGTVILKASMVEPSLVAICGWGGTGGNFIGSVALGAGTLATGHSNGATYTHISTATTTTCKSGAGILHLMTVNTAAALATITVYDNTAGSGTVIAVYTMPTTLLQSSFSTGPIDVAFSTGCTLVTTGTQDITVSTY